MGEPQLGTSRIVIVGGGAGGLELATRLLVVRPAFVESGNPVSPLLHEGELLLARGAPAGRS